MRLDSLSYPDQAYRGAVDFDELEPSDHRSATGRPPTLTNFLGTHRLDLVMAMGVLLFNPSCHTQRMTTAEGQRVVSVPQVPDWPPDSIPVATWNTIHSPENMVDSAPEWSAPFPKNIVIVMFQERASRDEKQHAIDAVQGVVVGGVPLRKGGYYYIRIPDDGTSRPLFRAIKKLKSFPQVELASPELPPLTPLRRN
jgi:fervidolysin-like protein